VTKNYKPNSGPLIAHILIISSRTTKWKPIEGPARRAIAQLDWPQLKFVQFITRFILTEKLVEKKQD